jgi:tetratricopeptide (TPR) repeat protein
MNRGLTFALALAVSTVVARPLAAQDVRADSGGIAIGGNVTGSTFNIGVPPEQLTALVRQSADLSESQKKLITKLEGELELNRRQIRAALDILGEANVEAENLAAKLVEVAERFKALQATATTRSGDDSRIAALKAQARQAIESGDLAKADALLADVTTEQRRTRAEHQRGFAEERRPSAERRRVLDSLAVDEAENLARRGDIAMTRLRYREAAAQFADAAAVFADHGPHWRKRIHYLEKEANALYRQGDNFRDNDALGSAAERYRALIASKPRDRVPLQWADAQYHLGFTLARLGERESGTARLEEALASYAEAQKELTREAQPFRWATIESARGSVLGVIGVRERGTARLDEAVAAYREVLKVVKRSRAPVRWAWAQMNLGTALARRGEHDRDARRLESAVAAHHRALLVFRREKYPFTWALTQTNLGFALSGLGASGGGTARSLQAIAAYNEALKEWTRERAPLRWAFAHHGLGNALMRTALHESGTARFEQAIATYDEALKERSRERAPIEWALTSGQQGVALMLLAERTNNAEPAGRAVAQIEASLDVMRRAGQGPREDYFRRQLTLARALVQRLRQP